MIDSLKVRPAVPGDALALCEMRHALWPDGSAEEHQAELEDYFSGRGRASLTILVAEDAAGRPVGFVELAIRPFAEGCTSDRVAYLEGWYVDPNHRGRGIGRALIEAAESWARANGLIEFASDGYADNEAGAAAHRAVGFEEVAVIRCFRKQLQTAHGHKGEVDA